MHNPAYEQFGNYPEIGWIATAAGGFYKAGDKFQINPDLETFKLERFVDLRKQLGLKPESFKLMLIDTRSKTNIFIDGPDSRMDDILKRLSKYKDMPWAEMKNMSLEKDFLNCNKAFTSICGSWMLENMELKPLKPGHGVPELDLNKADEICSKCKNFDPK